jgi:hypothetical protein
VLRDAGREIVRHGRSDQQLISNAWTLFAAVTGGVVSYAGGYFARRSEERKQRLALRAAFAAEIGAMLAIADVRQHESRLREWINRWENGEDHKAVFFGAPRELDPIFSKNVDKIGMLGADAADFVRWYTLLRALRVHFIAIEDGGLDKLPLPRRVAFVQQALDLGPELRRLGEKLSAPAIEHDQARRFQGLVGRLLRRARR